jgi:hypothetical protein
MTSEILIYIGGAYQLLWAFTHFYFPKLLDWGNALASLDDFNRILMLIFSKLLLVFYLVTALICFIFAGELPDTDIGLAVLIFLSLYWLVRALLQVQYFGFRKANTLNVQLSSSDVSNQTISYILFITFMIGFALFLVPAVLTIF